MSLGKPFGYIDIPGSSVQVKLHASDNQQGTLLTGGYLADRGVPVGYTGMRSESYLNGYQCAILDGIADKFGWNKGSY